MALVTAWNKRTKKAQEVPAHYVDNPHLFGGVFTTLPKSAQGSEQAPKTAPDAGDKNNKEQR